MFSHGLCVSHPFAIVSVIVTQPVYNQFNSPKWYDGVSNSTRLILSYRGSISKKCLKYQSCLIYPLLCFGLLPLWIGCIQWDSYLDKIYLGRFNTTQKVIRVLDYFEKKMFEKASHVLSQEVLKHTTWRGERRIKWIYRMDGSVPKMCTLRGQQCKTILIPGGYTI